VRAESQRLQLRADDAGVWLAITCAGGEIHGDEGCLVEGLVELTANAVEALTRWHRQRRNSTDCRRRPNPRDYPRGIDADSTTPRRLYDMPPVPSALLKEPRALAITAGTPFARNGGHPT
jgi:hypothetical protein